MRFVHAAHVPEGRCAGKDQGSVTVHTEPTKMPIAEGGPEVEVPPLPELARFVLPLMQGSLHQVAGLRFGARGAEYIGTLILIARRSARRPGVRHWRRGAEPQAGHLVFRFRD